MSRQKKQLTPEEEEERKVKLRRQKLESYYRRRAKKGLDTMEERQSKKRELIKDCIAKNMRIVAMVEKPILQEVLSETSLLQCLELLK